MPQRAPRPTPVTIPAFSFPASLFLLIASTLALGCSSSTSAGGPGGGGDASSSSSSSTSTNAGGAGGSPASSSSSSSAASSSGAGGAACVPVDDGNPCTDDVCSGGTAIHTPTPAGISCSMGGAQCDGLGTCGPSPCSNTLGLPPASGMTAGNGPIAVATADLNGDGKPDLVTANQIGDDVSVLLNLGNGSFAPAVSYAAGSYPTSLAVADLDGDGKPDLAVTNQKSSNISVLRNLGNGTFAPAVNYATSMYSTSIVAADIDGDGRPDLTVATPYNNGNYVNVFLNQGNGTFAAPVSYGFESNLVASAVAVADLDGNGKPDLAVTTYSPGYGGHVRVLLNQGNGTFAPEVPYSTADHPVSVTAADLDGDGKPDLAVTNYHSSVISVLSVRFNHGDGTFGPSVIYEAGDAPFTVAAADLDGDGKLDLAVANRGSINNWTRTNVSVLRNLGNGIFAPPVYYVSQAYPLALTPLDFDGDGKLDLAVVGTNVVSLLHNQGSGTFPAARNYASLGESDAIATADVNGDGKLDVITGGHLNTVMSVRLNLGDGTFAAPVEYPMSGGIYEISAADLNGDGKPDLVTTSYSSVRVWLDQADGTFAPAVTAVTYAVGSSTAVVADLDGNGTPDIVSLTKNPPNMSVLLNQGNGTFAPAITSQMTLLPTSIAAADLNADGKPDLAITDGIKTSVLLNLGSGTFSPAVTVSPTPGASSLVARDLDGDGKPDLAVANSPSGKVSVFLNQGNGTFAAAVTSPLGPAVGSMVAADMNTDGKLDLVVAVVAGGNQARTLLNLGGGVFALAGSYYMGENLSGVVAVDLNADGKPDLAVANGLNRTTSVLLTTCLP